jgi:hypothetical protein
MNCLRSSGGRDRGFESHLGHGCFVCGPLFSVCGFCIKYRPCDRPITFPNSPTDCEKSKEKNESRCRKSMV